MYLKHKHLKLSIPGVLLALACTSQAQSANRIPSTIELSSEEFVRMRCSTDGKDVFTEWRGSVYGFLPGQAQQKLFNIVGMNVARCFQDETRGWFLTSRELTYYLDPLTDKALHSWHNPFTNEVVSVVHVANNPVQNSLANTFKAVAQGDYITASIDAVITYPNVLAGQERFAEYGNQPLYQAAELFKFTAKHEQMSDTELSNVPMILAWDRIGPWLPWMKMKGAPGNLIYSVVGSKVSEFTDLPVFLQEEINTRMPMYQKAPSCKLKLRNETSWTYFAKHFLEYKEGKTFPLFAPQVHDECIVE